jgi:hypothetical protein
MTINDALHWMSVGTLLFYGIASTLMPKFVARNLEHVLNSGRGISEFRILHGGFFLGVGLFALYINNPLVFQAVGWAWIGAALVRIPAYFADRPTLPLSLVAFVSELVLGIFLLI